MILNRNIKLPNSEHLKHSRENIWNMLKRGTDDFGRALTGVAKNKLRKIYIQLTFIIQSV